MNCNTTHYRANSSSVPGDPTGVFAHLADASILRLQERHQFYVWKPGTDGTGEVRWMCSWDTTEQDVDAFVRDIGEVCA